MSSDHVSYLPLSLYKYLISVASHGKELCWYYTLWRRTCLLFFLNGSCRLQGTAVWMKTVTRSSSAARDTATSVPWVCPVSVTSPQLASFLGQWIPVYSISCAEADQGFSLIAFAVVPWTFSSSATEIPDLLIPWSLNTTKHSQHTLLAIFPGGHISAWMRQDTPLYNHRFLLPVILFTFFLVRLPAIPAAWAPRLYPSKWTLLRG